MSVYVCVYAESGCGVRTRTSHFPALIGELPPSLVDQFGGGNITLISHNTLVAKVLRIHELKGDIHSDNKSKVAMQPGSRQLLTVTARGLAMAASSKAH